MSSQVVYFPVLPLGGMKTPSTTGEFDVENIYVCSDDEYVVEFDVPVKEGAFTAKIDVASSPIAPHVVGIDPNKNIIKPDFYWLLKHYVLFEYEVLDKNGAVINSGEVPLGQSFNVNGGAYVRIRNKGKICSSGSFDFKATGYDSLGNDYFVSVLYYDEKNNYLGGYDLYVAYAIFLIGVYHESYEESTKSISFPVKVLAHLFAKWLTQPIPLMYKVIADDEYTITIKYVDNNGNIMCTETIIGGAGTIEKPSSCTIYDLEESMTKLLDHFDVSITTKGVVEIYVKMLFKGEVPYPVSSS